MIYYSFPLWFSTESDILQGSRGRALHNIGNVRASGVDTRVYGPQFNIGDVVGCGWDIRGKSLYFTYNGQYLGNAFANVRYSWIYRVVYQFSHILFYLHCCLVAASILSYGSKQTVLKFRQTSGRNLFYLNSLAHYQKVTLKAWNTWKAKPRL